MDAHVTFIAGDKKGTFYVDRKGWFVTGILGMTRFHGESIFSVEMQPLQNTATGWDVWGGALLGNLIAGDKGVVPGAIYGTLKKEALVAFYFRNGDRALGVCTPDMVRLLEVLIFENLIQEGAPATPLPRVADVEPKPKRTVVARILEILILLLLLCALSAFFGEEDETSTTQAPEAAASAEAPEAASAPQTPDEGPCAGITAETWEQANLLWRFYHLRCKPGQQNAPAPLPAALPVISREPLERHLAQALPALIDSAEAIYDRDFGSYALIFPQFGTEEGRTYAVQMTFSNRIHEPMARYLSIGLVLMLQDGLEKQGMTREVMKQHHVMLLGGAACTLNDKLISYGIAAVQPANSEQVSWIAQYAEQAPD